jgi:pyrroloquinoline quinone (PQQ) biosynthesis protein C
MAFIADRAISAEKFLEECIEFKRAQSPKSRFLRDLVLGKLDHEQLRVWAADFYYYVEPAIPSIAAWMANAPTLPDRRLYKLIAENLAGEMGFIREEEHHDLYVRFCAGLDLSHDEILESLPTAGTVGAASAVGHFCRSSFEEGLGGFGLAVEMELPETAGVAGVFAQALEKHYGIENKALEFWYVHVEAEDEHGRNARDALELCGQTREQQAIIRRAFQFSVIAHRGMREGYDAFLKSDSAASSNA